uniref:Reverse transcriptase domain-containing protein n=1 Tax=Tanacetum cinerariifolium TaxID=118510 RepID=A0A6L2LPE2_TANCI|nr:hypothetical protein [Tanacetum cinerariifolium]
MAKTIDQYTSKIRTDYGPGVARPKIKDKDHFKLKGQFLKELQENTFSSLNHEDANEHIEKVLEIVNLFHILDSRGAIPTTIVADAKVAIQEMAEYSQKWHNATSRGRNCPLKEEGKTLEEAYYTQFGVPFQGGGYRAAALGFYQGNNANPSYQERRQSVEETLRNFMGESTKRNEENSNLIKEIQNSMDAAIRNQGASIKTLEIQIGKISKVLQERGFRSLLSSTEPNPRDHIKLISTTVEADTHSIRRASISVMPLSTYLNLGLGELAHTNLTVELADRTVKYPKRIAKNVLVGIGKFVFLVDFIILDMPEDIKISLILGRPFLPTAHAKIDVFKRKITLRTLDPLNGGYIELNDLNEPLELRRNQDNNLMPTIEEGRVIDAPIDDLVESRDDELDTGSNDYPSCCDFDKICIDCAHQLKVFMHDGI